MQNTSVTDIVTIKAVTECINRQLARACLALQNHGEADHAKVQRSLDTAIYLTDRDQAFRAVFTNGQRLQIPDVVSWAERNMDVVISGGADQRNAFLGMDACWPYRSTAEMHYDPG